MAQSINNNALTALIGQILPAASTAGFYLAPVRGLSGESQRIDSPLGRWLARSDSGAGRLMGVCRRREFRVLRHVDGQSLAPSPVAYRDGWLIVAWIPGVPLTPSDIPARLVDGTLADMLAQLHHLPVYGYPLPLKALLDSHWRHMSPARRTPALLRLHRRFMRSPLPPTLRLSPLHLDIHADNVLAIEGGCRLIDWEYAADGDIALELAALYRAMASEAASWQTFLTDYCRHWRGIPLPLLTRRIGQWLPWVDYLMLMWFEVRWCQTGEPACRCSAQSLRQRMGLPW
ncbi:phosphotransferase [Musicola keenii]|uniref:phosphotransferase n=1 Tax=Musicola keenii TaxID=2884250 RepID=UPI00177AF3E0